MLTLYYKPTCPFCSRVLAVVDRLGVEVEKKDVSESEGLRQELIERGGKKQVPYLVDDTVGEAMYESDAIVSYLQTTYGSSTAGSAKPRVHISDSACTSCEG